MYLNPILCKASLLATLALTLVGCGSSTPAARHDTATMPAMAAPEAVTRQPAAAVPANLAAHSARPATGPPPPPARHSEAWSQRQPRKIATVSKPARGAKASSKRGKVSLLGRLLGTGRQRPVPAYYRSKNNLNSLRGLNLFGRRRGRR